MDTIHTHDEDEYVCGITGQRLPPEALIDVDAVRGPVFDLMLKMLPDWKPEGFISRQELNKFRQLYVQQLLMDEKGQLTELEQEVLATIENSSLVSENIEPEIEDALTFGDHIADNIAEFGGSWTFIISFLAFMAIWMGMNVWALTSHAFDPYPFILLNLVLSCLAALQAPIIMMSQNRQNTKDRKRSEHDYQVNLKAEIEIQQLHQKLDHLIQRQGQRMLDIQELQVEMLNIILNKVDDHNPKSGFEKWPN